MLKQGRSVGERPGWVTRPRVSRRWVGMVIRRFFYPKRVSESPIRHAERGSSLRLSSAPSRTTKPFTFERWSSASAAG